MRIAIVVGSHRPASQSAKVGNFIASQLVSARADVVTDLIDLGKDPLPLWDEGAWNGAARWESTWAPLSERLAAADAVVLVAPEWSGMAPPAVKNFLLLAGPDELGDKPGLLVAVSSGLGGSYPISELRSSGYKNNFVCWLPDHIIVRHAADVLNTDAATTDTDARLRERLAATLRRLIDYAEALATVRARDDGFRAKYQYGM